MSERAGEDQDRDGPRADEANGTDEPGGPGGVAGHNTPDDSWNGSGGDDDFL